MIPDRFRTVEHHEDVRRKKADKLTWIDSRSSRAVVRFTLVIFCILCVGSLLAQEDLRLANMGDPVNTPADEFAPSVTQDGKTLVFSSKRNGGRYPDIFVTHKSDQGWSEPEPIVDINSRYSDESPSISGDGKMLFFSSDREGSLEYRAAGSIRVSFDLYMSYNENGSWTRPIKVPGDINTIHHERSPSFDEKTRTLFFSRWAFGDFNQAEIWKSEMTAEGFTTPEKLPPQINAGYQEAGFTPARDRSGYYFASRRPGGLGGWDLYYTEYKDGEFGEPLNLGDRINSKENDIYLTLFQDQLFFCSDREGGAGNYDIYAIDYPEEQQQELRFVVRNARTGDAVQSRVRLDLNAEQSLARITDEHGRFAIAVPAETSAVGDGFTVRIQQRGFLPFERTFSEGDLNGLSADEIPLELSPIEKDASFTLHAIQFDYNSATIRPESYPVLDELVDYLSSNPDVKLEIIGHTDLHGEYDYNMRLSRERAQAVFDYLTARELNRNRFRVSGAGFTRPLIDRKGSPYDEQNRRTEFRVLE